MSGVDIARLVEELRAELAEMKVAPSATSGLHAANWSDKPHRVLYDAIGVANQALDALLAQAAELAEARAEIERYRVEVVDRLAEAHDAHDRADEALAALKASEERVTGLQSLVAMFRERIERRGNWDDGCFYYGNTSASELQEPLNLARSLLPPRGRER